MPALASPAFRYCRGLPTVDSVTSRRSPNTHPFGRDSRMMIARIVVSTTADPSYWSLACWPASMHLFLRGHQDTFTFHKSHFMPPEDEEIINHQSSIINPRWVGWALAHADSLWNHRRTQINHCWIMTYTASTQRLPVIPVLSLPSTPSGAGTQATTEIRRPADYSRRSIRR